MMGLVLPILIVVSGLPGTGKSTIARELAAQLQLPLLGKDEIKEILFEHFGTGDRSWSKVLSQVAYAILFKVAANVISSGSSMIIEANFPAKLTRETLMDIQSRTPFDTFEINCVSSREVLLQRHQSRLDQDVRHPGHLDKELIKEIEASHATGENGAINLGGGFLELNTDHFNMINVGEVIFIIHNYSACHSERREESLHFHIKSHRSIQNETLS